jgi:hypothetical protein
MTFWEYGYAIDWALLEAFWKMALIKNKLGNAHLPLFENILEDGHCRT